MCMDSQAQHFTEKKNKVKKWFLHLKRQLGEAYEIATQSLEKDADALTI